MFRKSIIERIYAGNYFTSACDSWVWPISLTRRITIYVRMFLVSISPASNALENTPKVLGEIYINVILATERNEAPFFLRRYIDRSPVITELYNRCSYYLPLFY